MDDPSQPGGPGAASPAELFAIVWDSLVDILGTSATATLVRKSVKRVAAHAPDLAAPSIGRDGFGFTYDCPETWSERTPASMAALRGVARELGPLLAELTGPVILRRLAAIPELERSEIKFQENA